MQINSRIHHSLLKLCIYLPVCMGMYNFESLLLAAFAFSMALNRYQMRACSQAIHTLRPNLAFEMLATSVDSKSGAALKIALAGSGP